MTLALFFINIAIVLTIGFALLFKYDDLVRKKSGKWLSSDIIAAAFLVVSTFTIWVIYGLLYHEFWLFGPLQAFDPKDGSSISSIIIRLSPVIIVGLGFSIYRLQTAITEQSRKDKQRSVETDDKETNQKRNQENEQRAKKFFLTSVVVCLVILLYVLIVDENSFTNGEMPHENTAETSEPKGSTKDSGEDSEKNSEIELTEKVVLTENYQFYIPKDVETYENTPEDDGFTNEQIVILDNGKTVIRSFIINNEPDCFPGLVEYFYEDIDAEPSYSPFFNTALATAEDETADTDGVKMYRKSFFWPDGGSTLCSISVQAYDKKSLKLADRILNSVECKGKKGWQSEGYDDAAGQVTVDEHGHIVPSQEEINEALMHEAQQAYDEYMIEQMEPGSNVYPYY